MSSPYEALFSAVRDIPAADAAKRLNIKLRRRGNRFVALCPIHREKTPSLTFYPDGHFFCFGCQERGGAIERYQKALGVSALEAARALAVDFNIIEPERDAPTFRRGPSAMDLKRVLDTFKGHRWSSLCDQLHQSRDKADTIAAMVDNPEICAELPSFWQAVQDAANADAELCQLEDAGPTELLMMAGGK